MSGFDSRTISLTVNEYVILPPQQAASFPCSVASLRRFLSSLMPWWSPITRLPPQQLIVWSGHTLNKLSHQTLISYLSQPTLFMPHKDTGIATLAIILTIQRYLN
ncbi:hypothetical protein ABPG74_021326 [Tetrahymena malaccensis]